MKFMPALKLNRLYGCMAAFGLLASCGCAGFRPQFGFFGQAPAAPPAPAASGDAVAQASYTERGPGLSRPTVSGSQLNLKPDETVVERALELVQKLTQAEEEKKTLGARVQQLESQVEEREKALRQAETEVKAATMELTQARSDLQRWKQQVVGLREKLGSAEKDNLETLQSIVNALEQLLERKKQTEEPAETTEEVVPKLPKPRRN
jgi:outer membrane murein-binding lipoprotein Lpp